MVEITHKALVADITAAISVANMSKADFGKKAVNDPCLVYDLEKGRELRRKTLSKVESALLEIKGARHE